MSDKTESAATATITRHVPRGAAAKEVALRVVHSPDDSLRGRFCLLEGLSATLGRKGGRADICINDGAVSRENARAIWDADHRTWTIEDLGSRNGVFVNGRQVQREYLAPFDLLRIGDTLIMHVEFDSSLSGWTVPVGSGIVGCSASLKAVVDQIRLIAPTKVPVLVTGETGVGKELVAQSLHAQSGVEGPFVAVNCATLTAGLAASELFGHVRGSFSNAHRAHEGLFLSAREGTLFLDEVGELDLQVQAQLLRGVEEKVVRPVGSLRPVPADVRLLAATNVDLAKAVEQGTFRNDLLARLGQWLIRLAPLRERREDIPVLADHFLRAFGQGVAFTMTGEFVEALMLRRWTQNVRELSATLRSTLIRHPTGGLLEKSMLPDLFTEPESETTSAQMPLAEVAAGEAPTRSELDALMRHFGGCVADVSRHLGRKRMQVYRWLDRHELDPGQYRK